MQKRCSQKPPRLGRELALSSLRGQEPREVGSVDPPFGSSVSVWVYLRSKVSGFGFGAEI